MVWKISSTSPLERWVASTTATLLSSADGGRAEGPGGVDGAGRSAGAGAGGA